MTGYLDFCPTLPKYFRPTLSHIEMEITQLNRVAKIPDYETGGALPRAQSFSAGVVSKWPSID